SWVPPIEVTSGSDDGHELTGNGYVLDPSAVASVAPSSPDEASTVTLCSAASLNAYRRFSRLEKSALSKPGNVFSVAPKLCVMTSPTPLSMSAFSAFIISGNPVTPSVSATGVSTSTMCAPGAIAWAYSTSSVVSCAQPTMSELVGSNGGMAPACTISTLVSGRPHWASNACRSCWMVGEPNESTMTIVRP